MRKREENSAERWTADIETFSAPVALPKRNRKHVSLHQAAVSYAERRMINQAMGLTVNETPGAVPLNSRPGSGVPLK